MISFVNANPIAVDLNNIYVSAPPSRLWPRDQSTNNKILKFDYQPGVYVGQDEPGFVDGPGATAKFASPTGLTYHRGNLYVIDYHNSAIRKVDSDRNVTTFASSDRGININYASITCITSDKYGNIYLTVYAERSVVRITPTGVITEFENALPTDSPRSIAVDTTGTLYVTSKNVHCIHKKKLEAEGEEGEIKIHAGIENYRQIDGPGAKYVDATGEDARFNLPWGLALDHTDNSDDPIDAAHPENLYVADFYNGRIRKITPGGVVTTIAGMSVGSESSFNFPRHLALHPRDNILYMIGGEEIDVNREGEERNVVAEPGTEQVAILTIDLDRNTTTVLYSHDMNFNPPPPPAPTAAPPAPTAAPPAPPARTVPPPAPPAPIDTRPHYLTPPQILSKDIETGSGDIISFEDIEEGSIVGQIVGDDGTIAKSSYYFETSLKSLWDEGPRSFIDPITRKPIVGVNWYKAHLVPPGSLKGGRKTRKVKKVKRSTFRVNRKKRKTRKQK